MPDTDHPDTPFADYLAELHASGIFIVNRQTLARAIVATLPYETFATPEKYADALLASVSADMQVAGEVLAA